MFLILGTEKCRFCKATKDLLEPKDYLYIDLETLYADWKQILEDLKLDLQGQRSIPIIFHSSAADPVPLGTVEELKAFKASGWTFLGTYFDLMDHLASGSDSKSKSEVDSELEVDDNY